jgi:hypothetical protein
MADSWRTFHHDGKISPCWLGWGVHAHPLSLYLPSCKKLLCTLQLRVQIHSPYFISANYPYMYSVGTYNSDYVVGSVWGVWAPADRMLDFDTVTEPTQVPRCFDITKYHTQQVET